MMVIPALIVQSLLVVDNGALVVGPGGASAMRVQRERGRVESFLDGQRISSMSGLTRSINKPTLHGSNPIFGSAADTWDDSKASCSVQRVSSGEWRMLYDSTPDEYTAENQVSFLCLATSTNGISWVRPTIGLVEYGGNSENNILLARTNAPAINDVAVVMVGTQLVCSTFGGLYYTSSDGTNWTYAGSMMPAGQTYETWGVTELVSMRDGTLRAYAQYWVNPIRHGSYAVGSVGETFRARTQIPIGLKGGSASDQRYWTTVSVDAGNWYGFVGDYSDATYLAHVDLYYSRNGRDWTIVSDQWIPRGSAGAWDDAVVLPGKSLIRDGNTWYHHYTADSELHYATNHNHQVGLATIGWRRIGQVGTTGTLITSPFIASGPLLVNCNASGGILRAELLDPVTMAALPGWTTNECNGVTADTYETEITWSGKSLLWGQYAALRFGLADATLYSYSVGDPCDGVEDEFQ